MENVAIWLGVIPKMKRENYSSERRRFTFSAGEKPGEEKNPRLTTEDTEKAQRAQRKKEGKQRKRSVLGGAAALVA